MPARLVSLSGYPTIRLDAVVVMLGRHENCDVQINSPRVSRRHCCLIGDPAGVLVRDLNSANGTWINGTRVEDGLLRSGDELAVAHLRYRLEIYTDPGDTTPPQPRRAMPAPVPSETLPPTDMYDRCEVVE